MAKVHVYVPDQLLAQLRELDTPEDPVNMSALVRKAVVGDVQRRRAGAPGVTPDPAAPAAD